MIVSKYIGCSPFSKVGEDLVEEGVLLSEASSKGLNSSVLLHLVVKDGTDLSLLDLMLESVGGALVVAVCHVVEGSNSPLSLGLSESVSKNVELDSLDLLLGVLSLVTLTVDVTRNVVDLSLSLLNGGV